MASSGNEHVEKIDVQISQLKARKQAILKREKEKERKARTRRLIQNGALAEQYLQCEGIQSEEFEKLLQSIVSIPAVAETIC